LLQHEQLQNEFKLFSKTIVSVYDFDIFSRPKGQDFLKLKEKTYFFGIILLMDKIFGE